MYLSTTFHLSCASQQHITPASLQELLLSSEEEQSSSAQAHEVACEWAVPFLAEDVPVPGQALVQTILAPRLTRHHL